MSMSVIKFLLSSTSFSMFCGFAPGTIVKTRSGEIRIDELIVADQVCTDNDQAEITTKNFAAKSAVCIVLDDQQIIACQDQLFFVPDINGWKQASALKPHDQLLNYENELIIIHDVYFLEQPTEIIDLSLTEPHTFYVSNKHILVHNYAPIVLAVAETAPVIIEVAKVGVVGLAALFAKQIQKKGRRSLGGSAAPQPRPPHEPEDENSQEWKQKHPNGKYRDALYHHQNSRTLKSRAPKNGQRALDNSQLVKEKGNAQWQQRVGISEGEIVVLNQETVENGNRVFHGHVEVWGDLHEKFRSVLIQNKICSSAGKIL